MAHKIERITTDILAVGLKLMRIMFHVVKYKEYYDSTKALGDERLRQIQNVA